MAQAKMAAAMAAKHADDAAAGESARPALAPPPDESAWPALAPPPLAESSSSASSVDEGGFAVDELNAALEASMRETKRPKGGAGAGAASGSRETSAPAGPGAGLRNLEGEHNCFLNVVVQSLWHIPAFNRAVQTLHPVAGVSRADESVATALREVFVALDAAAGVKPPNAWGSGGDAAKRVAAPPPPPGPPPPSAKHVGAANGNANGHGKANGHGGVAVAPTWKGPYERRGPTRTRMLFAAEDPALWPAVGPRGERRGFHMLVHRFAAIPPNGSSVAAGVGGHAFSLDGLEWRYAPHGAPAYDNAVVWRGNGSRTRLYRRERPQPVVDAHGRLLGLFNGAWPCHHGREDDDAHDAAVGCASFTLWTEVDQGGTPR